MTSSPTENQLSDAAVEQMLARLERLRREIGSVIVGQQAAIDQVLVAFLAGGHALLEGVPGLAKTLMVRTLAQALELSFHRIQFTPDLMPTDIVGTEILEEDHGTGRRFFKFAKGPVFANVLLADEINRTPPKTQAAMLEAMQEREVTYGGNTYRLDQPFFVLATQNPIEQSGTYPLPEAQLDRFLLYIKVPYPEAAEEVEILRRTTGEEQPAATAVLSGAEVLNAQALVRQVHASDQLLGYAAQLVRASRPDDSPIEFVRQWVRWGAGPRAGQSLILASKARALLAGRYAVTDEDIRAVLPPVLRHRVLVRFRAEAEGITPDDVIARIEQETARPASPLA